MFALNYEWPTNGLTLAEVKAICISSYLTLRLLLQSCLLWRKTFHSTKHKLPKKGAVFFKTTLPFNIFPHLSIDLWLNGLYLFCCESITNAVTLWKCFSRPWPTVNQVWINWLTVCSGKPHRTYPQLFQWENKRLANPPSPSSPLLLLLELQRFNGGAICVVVNLTQM